MPKCVAECQGVANVTGNELIAYKLYCSPSS